MLESVAYERWCGFWTKSVFHIKCRLFMHVSDGSVLCLLDARGQRPFYDDIYLVGAYCQGSFLPSYMIVSSLDMIYRILRWPLFNDLNISSRYIDWTKMLFTRKKNQNIHTILNEFLACVDSYFTPHWPYHPYHLELRLKSNVLLVSVKLQSRNKHIDNMSLNDFAPKLWFSNCYFLFCWIHHYVWNYCYNLSVFYSFLIGVQNQKYFYFNKLPDCRRTCDEWLIIVTKQ